MAEARGSFGALDRRELKMPAKLILAATLSLIASGSPQDWEKADRATKRLPPAAFTILPAPIRQDLERRGCTIPQAFAARGASNVVSGRFISATAKDWAVLCSIKQSASILVFRGGSVSSVDELATFADSTFLQVVGPNQEIGYSRAITVATAAYIRQRNGSELKIPRLDHDGINDLFVEKGSTVWYWYGGRWWKLLGGD